MQAQAKVSHYGIRMSVCVGSLVGGPTQVVQMPVEEAPHGAVADRQEGSDRYY